MSATEDLNEYIAAKAAIAVASKGTSIFKHALTVAAEKRDLQYDVPIRCILCKTEFPFTTTIAQMAEWQDAPRGICDSCDDATTMSVTVGGNG